MVCELQRELKFPLKKLLVISEHSNKDGTIEEAMLEIRVEHANAGYRPMTELLKQRGFHVNHKKVHRLMKKPL